jgi:hypothetical protein
VKRLLVGLIRWALMRSGFLRRLLAWLRAGIAKYEVLPGSEWARLAIPLDYPPSRDFRPRYGYTTAPISEIHGWFKSHDPQYLDFLRHMRSLPLAQINRQFVHLSDPAWPGGAICSFDALALYAMIVKYRPRIYLEVGSGMTTLFARQAAKDHGLNTRIISIDPEPRAAVDAACDEVVRTGLEVCDLSIFDQLGENDILFVDGSHRSFMNSDVTVFFIDVLPRVRPGVLIHLHDITLPWDYPEMFRDWYWNEQYLLAVYLMAAKERLDPVLPTAYICRAPWFDAEMPNPIVDLGKHNDGWKGGGSMWFTKR